MGNSHNQISEHGAIAIRTEKPFYFAGDLVRGNIFLNICKAGYQGNIIQFTIIGKEKTEWDEGSGEDQRTYRGKNKFYSQTVPIYTFQNQVAQIGQYVFPFQFQLHPHLPGSFYQKNHGDYGYIYYQVKAKFTTTQPNKPNIRNKQEFIVREPIKQMVISQEQERTANLSICCCINKGSSRVKSFCDKNHYLPGDTAQMTVEIDNSNCNLNIDYIEIELQKVLILRANTSSHKYTQKILTQRIPGVQARSQQVGSQSRNIQITLLNQNNPQNELTPTTNGKLVNQQYYLKVIPKFEGCICCSEKPVISFQIVMLYKIPPNYIQPLPQPSDWNPQTFEPVLINFDQQNNMNIANNNMQQNDPFISK
ncbi:unnamed protein product [Paramecium primaurelia]|uniref:Arrestin C-terminal-like domain-containing protein n=1 Tax=Paramecium primaurelia TaxID=5886 RepID=A0A8S1JNP0_PARPR|nr:unnamed protein product [Paramecium primaurelia]